MSRTHGPFREDGTTAAIIARHPGDAATLPRRLQLSGRVYRARSATPARVALAPRSFIPRALRSRSSHTPQKATATTEVSRTGATTDSGAMLNATSTNRYALHMNPPI